MKVIMDDLFQDSISIKPESLNLKLPLAARMRPETLEEVLGQDHLLAPGKLLRRTIESDRLTSLIFYGPPGSGKTTLAMIISRVSKAPFFKLNAVTSNVAELRKFIEEIERGRSKSGRKGILFIDEIHRFNKAQQDILMPGVEHGDFILVGATTHNPSFVLNAPLISRSLVCELRPLADKDLQILIQKAISLPQRGLGHLSIQLTKEALGFLAAHAAGDARKALTALEVGVLTTPPSESGQILFDLEVAKESCQRSMVHYDHDEDYHYDTISAFIKSIRGSDPDAAVYWLAKMLYAGEDPRFIIRRLLILASEDIGNADPQALILAASGLEAVEFVGMPEARIILAQLVTYMALAPKSNASYEAISKATQDILEGKTLEVPAHLRDSHTNLAKKLGHGQGYQYPHSHTAKAGEAENPMPRGQSYLSEDLQYYHPKESGFEKTLSERLKQLRSKSR